MKFPVSSKKEYMQDKKIDYKALSIATLYSKMKPKEILYELGEDELFRYTYQNKLKENKVEIEEFSNLKIPTIIKTINKLSNLDNNLINSYKTDLNEVVYYINYCTLDENQYVLIEEEILKKLISIGNTSLIKTYILLKYLCKNSYKRISRKFIASNIGLSATKSSLDIITDITNTLVDNNLISKKYINMTSNKIYIEYKVNSYEEWSKMNNIIE